MMLLQGLNKGSLQMLLAKKEEELERTHWSANKRPKIKDQIEYIKAELKRREDNLS